ncbi:MAG: hypothetical protein JEZ04_19100 [Spirochaetales bacterium]|nr:hypothetical protein [Spirochaetales bacterium]
MIPNLIVMLTNNDETVSNALEVFKSCADLPVKFWGFKDIGLPKTEMKSLVENMRSVGKETFLEIVSLSESECLDGAKLAVECGFDYLMGTVYFESVFLYLKKNRKAYFPFCGRIEGHPSILKGTPEEITEDAYVLQQKGVQGVDVLAYRHESDAEKVSELIVERLDIPVVIAGSISSFDRIDVMKRINPWAFTIGTAYFDKKFVKNGTFREQVIASYDYLQK